jgi:hypothetical protein
MPGGAHAPAPGSHTHTLPPQSAINATQATLLKHMRADWLVAGAAKDAFDFRQLFNATCLCTNGTLSLNGTAGFGGSSAYLASNCSGTVELYYRRYNDATNTTDVLLAAGQVQARKRRPPGNLATECAPTLLRCPYTQP